MQYIIIHYTGISNDTAENEVKYFATGNTRAAGAHFFVGQNGHVCQSIKMSQIARSVPRKRQTLKGGGAYLGKCTSSNSISIELCDNLDKDPSIAQTNAVRELVAYIRSVCPNAKTIVRHYDVTGKLCPARMVDEKKWDAFKAAITKQEKEVEDLTKEETIAVIRDVVPGIVEDVMKKVIDEAANNIPSWFVMELQEAKDLGITDGSRPGANATRCETAVMVKRGVEYAIKKFEKINKGAE